MKYGTVPYGTVPLRTSFPELDSPVLASYNFVSGVIFGLFFTLRKILLTNRIPNYAIGKDREMNLKHQSYLIIPSVRRAWSRNWKNMSCGWKARLCVSSDVMVCSKTAPRSLSRQSAVNRLPETQFYCADQLKCRLTFDKSYCLILNTG
jgi:hypothetical protein